MASVLQYLCYRVTINFIEAVIDPMLVREVLVGEESEGGLENLLGVNVKTNLNFYGNFQQN